MKLHPDHQHGSVLLLDTAEVVERPGDQPPRVGAAVSIVDGCGGVGWFEWNRNTSQR